MRELLTRGADIAANSNNGSTALKQASLKGHAETVRELLSRGALLNAQAANGSTPLMWACENGHLATATLLLDAGADLALLDNAGWSALRWANRLVARNAAPRTATPRAERSALVLLLRARGAQ